MSERPQEERRTEEAATGGRGPSRTVWLRPVVPTGSLRAQLLLGIAVLLLVALLAIAIALLVWLPADPAPATLLLGLGGLIVADVAVVLLFGDYILRHRFIEPVERMVVGAEAIAGGELSRRLEKSGADELRRVAESVNRMADHLIRNQELLAENVRSLDETNRALTETRDELIQAEKLASVGRLAAGIAHEVGNPLGAILGYVEVARRRGGAGAEWLDDIEQEARRLDRTVRGLLDFARPREAAARAFPLNDLVEETVELLHTQGRLREVSVETELQEDGPVALGDRHQMEQVLVNLLLNAEDAIAAAGGGEGRVTLRTTTERYHGPTLPAPERRRDDPDGVDYSHLRRFRKTPALHAPRFRRGQPVARLEILDNGPGVESAEVDRIFEPFFTTKEEGRGTGLGLAVCARLVAGMGGAILARPRAEGGLRMAVLLPGASDQGAGKARAGEEEAGAADRATVGSDAIRGEAR